MTTFSFWVGVSLKCRLRKMILFSCKLYQIMISLQRMTHILSKNSIITSNTCTHQNHKCKLHLNLLSGNRSTHSSSHKCMQQIKSTHQKNAQIRGFLLPKFTNVYIVKLHKNKWHVIEWNTKNTANKGIHHHLHS